MAPAVSQATGSDVISVIYEGELARSGQLHFYEYGRAVYGLARLVSTIENFRRTGRVAKKVSSKSYVNIIITAPERGSFPIDILVPIAAEASKYLSAIPPSVLFKYVIHLITRLLPKEEKAVIELAKIELEREKQRTRQSHHETKRLSEIRKMVESQNVTTQTALKVLETALEATDSRIYDVDSTPAEIRSVRTKLLTSEEREKTFETYRGELESVDQDRLARLTSRIRPQVAEVALPLRRSANRMLLAEGPKRQNFAELDRATVDDINSRSMDEEATTIEILVKAYDRDTGVGRCDLVHENLRRVSFSVPIEGRARLRRLILRAMNQDAVKARVRIFRDKSKRITSVILYNIIFG